MSKRVAVRCSRCGFFFWGLVHLIDGRWFVDCPLCGPRRWRAPAPGGHVQARD